MTNTVVKVVWHMTGVKWVDEDPTCDVMAVTVNGRGQDYAVCVSGFKGMKVQDIVNAMRAATAGLIHAAGGDMSVVGCSSPDDNAELFDTGDQRPS